MFGSVAADGSEPVLPLTVLGSSGGGVEIEAVIDTGFDGELTLPMALIQRLAYPFAGNSGGMLADGSEVQFDYHDGRVIWHGLHRAVVAIVAESQPLIGMALLRGSRLQVDAEPDGKVVVEDKI